MMMMILSLVVVMLMLWIVTMTNIINWSPDDDFYILMEKMVNIG